MRVFRRVYHSIVITFLALSLCIISYYISLINLFNNVYVDTNSIAYRIQYTDYNCKTTHPILLPDKYLAFRNFSAFILSTDKKGFTRVLALETTLKVVFFPVALLSIFSAQSPRFILDACEKVVRYYSLFFETTDSCF